ncbi:unnamed protein product [Urochloa decumbens]|uniref:Rx N-terminal domain-containing protein n=1 Tax=Urochloa decumbens TaxID=240449 RepID=A0ABC9AVL9_9POAL
MADVAFDAVKLVVNFIREEARLQGRAGDDVRFIMDEMESMNNLLHQLVSMNKQPNNSHDTAAVGDGGGNYSHLRTWMKQLLELAFDSRNSVELYIQSGDTRCYWLPWAVVARHRVVSQIRDLKERAREISERQGRYGGGLLLAQRQGREEDAADGSAVLSANSSQKQRRRAHASSSSSLARRVILDREFVDNSSVDEALLRLKVLRSSDDGSGGEESSDDGSGGEESSDGEPEMDGSNKQQKPTHSVVGNKAEPSDDSDNLLKQTQLDAQEKQRQSDGSNKQPTQSDSDAGDKKQQSDSDAGDKKQQKPETEFDASGKQKQLVSGDSDKPAQQQPTRSDSGDKQPQQQPTQSDSGDKQPQPQLDVSDKKQQSDGTDTQQQDDKQDKQDGSDKKKKKKKKKKIRVVTILVKDGTDEAAVGEAVLKRYNILRDADKLFDRWLYGGRHALHVSVRRPPILPEIIVHIANQAKKKQRQMEASRHPLYYYPGSSQAVSAAGDDEFKDWKQAEDSMPKIYDSGHPRLRRQLLILSGLSCPKILDDLKSFLCRLPITRPFKFAIALCTNDTQAAADCSYPATDNEQPITYSLLNIYMERAMSLLPSSYKDDDTPPTVSSIIWEIIKECSPDEVCMKMILHALYYNPDMTKQDMKRLKDSLVGTGHEEKENRIINFCYQSLPNDYKNCLWYSSVFTRGIDPPARVRRGSLLRRWMAQGLIKEEDEAIRCFDAMVKQKFINSHQVSGMGKVKSCAVHALVDDLIRRECPTVEDLLLNNQLPIGNLELLYSIRNGMKLHLASSSVTITSLLNSMSSTSMELLGVLDLEGHNDLNSKDLSTICKIRKLKYLSLRSTNVDHLPKQIGQLENLETLDIRGTKVLVFHTVLPKLKHLLAGRIIDGQDTDVIKSKESFSTVCMPRAVGNMEKLEILSHVKVTDGRKELINVGDKLEHLKKLGVVLSGKKASLKDLFLQIEKLNRCLRSLSIRMEPPGDWDAAEVILLRPPKLLESLHICSIRRGLPPRIKELHHLAKITLRDTFLKQDDLCVLGMLPKLRFLGLFYHSFGEGTITFGDSGRDLFFRDFEDDLNFKNLADIAIEEDTITSVTLNILPKLEKMTWSFSYMESLSGVQNVRSLTHLFLNGGSYNPEGLQKLQREIDRNRIDFKLNPPQHGEESRVVGYAP